MRILIVEDEVKIRVGISKLISSQSGHTIVGEAKNGMEGYEMAIRLRPELIITDIRMPVMNWLEMLAKIQEDKVACHSVILSGYSEFEYAKKAITLGADDYLLKPIAAEDVKEVLDRIEEKLDLEKRQIEGTPQGYIRDIILGSLAETRENYQRLADIGGLDLESPCFLYAGYLGNAEPAYVEFCKNQLEEMKVKYGKDRIYMVFIESTQEYVCVIQSENPMEGWNKRISHRVYLKNVREGQAVWTAGSILSLTELRSQVNELRKLTSYAMALGYTHLLTKREISLFTPEEFTYPVFLENRIKVSVCKGDSEELTSCGDKFRSYMRDQKCEPYHIRQGYMKMVNYILNISQEVAEEGYRLIQEQNPIKTLGNAITLSELETCFQKIIQILAKTVNKKDDIRNYTVNRAISYIREHYMEVISLEEMARRLDITPEYLSTLFNKEVGINFSTFLKKFRISQAKRLLKGSELKIYEVANEVGYGDPKYFNRVFREEVGVSPGDYRQS